MASILSAASEGARKSCGTQAYCTVFLLGEEVYYYYYSNN